MYYTEVSKSLCKAVNPTYASSTEKIDLRTAQVKQKIYEEIF
jgi:hypothetical protein